MTPVAHCGDLYDVSYNEHEDTKAQTTPSSPPICCICSAESTYECADGHERDEQRLVDGDEGSVTRRTLAEAVDEVVEEKHS